MNKSTIKPIDYGLVSPIQYQILRELHKGEKSETELSDILAIKAGNEITLKIKQGNKNVKKLADTLFNIEERTSNGLTKLIHLGFVCGRNGTSEDPEPYRAEDKHWLSEKGENFYKSVYE